MIEKRKIKFPIIVEGRYDKAALASLFDTTVITTGGFSIFNNKEKQALIKKLAERGGIILLTDSDGGGKQIRSFLSGLIEKDRLHHVYIPQIAGKERRKSAPSKAGFLGVEGVGREVLEKALSPFAEIKEKPQKKERALTKLDLFQDGLSGGDGSSEKREKLALELGLPKDMSANALIEIINLAYGYSAYREAYDKLFAGNKKI